MIDWSACWKRVRLFLFGSTTWIPELGPNGKLGRMTLRVDLGLLHPRAYVLMDFADPPGPGACLPLGVKVRRWSYGPPDSTGRLTVRRIVAYDLIYLIQDY